MAAEVTWLLEERLAVSEKTDEIAVAQSNLAAQTTPLLARMVRVGIAAPMHSGGTGSVLVRR